MKKKLLVLTTIMIMSIAMTGCGGETDVADTTTEATTEQTTEEVTEDKTTTEDATTEETTEKQTDSKTEDKTDSKSEASDKADSKTSASNNKGSAGNKNSTSGNKSNSVTAASTPSQSSTPSVSTTQPANQTTECQHNWVEQTKTVHHDAVYEEVIKEPADVYYWYCDVTKTWYHSYADDPCGSGSGSSGRYVAKPAVTEVICKQDAYDEQVGIGMYQCSKCGAMK